MRRQSLYIYDPFSHGFSLDLDGNIEDLMNQTNNVFGFSTAWSVSVWFKGLASPTVVSTIFQMRPAANLFSQILIRILGTTANDPYEITISDSAGIAIKIYTYDSLMSADWSHIVLTWDGTNMKFYKNGVFITPTTTATDGSGTMADTSRRIGVGNSTTGAENTQCNLHSMALWSMALSASDIVFLYNGGNGARFNVETIQRANLIQWALYGYADGDLFHNQVGTVDTGLNQLNIADVDRVQVSPG